LNCSIGIAASRLVAKIASDQAKRHGILHVLPGQEAEFLAPLDIHRIPGVGDVTGQNLNNMGIRRIRDLAALDEDLLRSRFGRLGLALAGKARGEDAGGWFDTAIGEDNGPKSISHEHTYTEDTADQSLLESTLAKLSEMVARRVRDHGLFARTVQLKLRHQDFSTITRAHTLEQPTQMDADLFRESRALFRANWKPGRKIRLLGVQVSSLTESGGQMNLLSGGQDEKWQKALSAVDKLRGRFGDTTVSLAAGMQGEFRQRVHEGKEHKPKP
jgi:DNA polymerase-4